MEIELLIEFCSVVRESTIKRLAKVPQGYENWKVSSGALSFAEIAKHLIDCDNWLFEKIKNPNIKSIETETAVIKYCDSNFYEELLNNLKEVLETKINFIKNFDEDSLNSKIFDDRFNSEVSISWIILRGNIDHEIHHRGQLSAYLRVLKDNNLII
jgi:uncharacterized damage-inducible protein DinB